MEIQSHRSRFFCQKNLLCNFSKLSLATSPTKTLSNPLQTKENSFESFSNLLSLICLISPVSGSRPFVSPSVRLLLHENCFPISFDFVCDSRWNILLWEACWEGTGASWAMLQIKDSSGKLELTASKQPRNNNFEKFLIETFLLWGKSRFSSSSFVLSSSRFYQPQLIIERSHFQSYFTHFSITLGASPVQRRFHQNMCFWNVWASKESSVDANGKG